MAGQESEPVAAWTQPAETIVGQTPRRRKQLATKHVYRDPQLGQRGKDEREVAVLDEQKREALPGNGSLQRRIMNLALIPRLPVRLAMDPNVMGPCVRAGRYSIQ